MKYFDSIAFLSKCLCIFRNKLTVDNKQLTSLTAQLSIEIPCLVSSDFPVKKSL